MKAPDRDHVIIPFSSFSKMELTTRNMSSLPPHEGTGDLVTNPFSSFSQKQLTTRYLSSLPPHEGTRDLVVNPFSILNSKIFQKQTCYLALLGSICIIP